MKDKLFVYGTLMTGKRPTDCVVGTLFNLGAFPGIILNGRTLVKGEILEVNESMLEQLDVYEGVSSGLYRRELIKTFNGVEAWIYLFNKTIPEYAKIIESGKWR